jgi:hypothetical protein
VHKPSNAFPRFLETAFYAFPKIVTYLQRILVEPNRAHEFLQSEGERSSDFRFVSGVMRYERQWPLDLELRLHICLSSQDERNGLFLGKSV